MPDEVYEKHLDTKMALKTPKRYVGKRPVDV
jgi:hypothetical protein